MSALSIQPTYPIFTDIDGQPLEDGYVWIGQANLDPQGNPIQVYWDAALTLLAGQPIRTRGGYPVNSGTPARLYVNSDYSIRVMNKNGSVVYSAPTATERYSDVVLGTINAEDVFYDPPFSGGVQTNLEAKVAQYVSVLDFGADPTGANDSTAAFNLALDAGTGFVVAPKGTYKILGTILLRSYTTLDLCGSTLVGGGTGSATNMFESAYSVGGVWTSNISEPLSNVASHILNSVVCNGRIENAGTVFRLNNWLMNCRVEGFFFFECTKNVYASSSFYSTFERFVSFGTAGATAEPAYHFKDFVNVEGVKSIFVSDRALAYLVEGGASALKFDTCSAENCGNGFKFLNGVGPLTFTNCYIENIANIGIDFSAATDVNADIDNCFFYIGFVAIWLPPVQVLSKVRIGNKNTFATWTHNTFKTGTPSGATPARDFEQVEIPSASLIAPAYPPVLPTGWTFGGDADVTHILAAHDPTTESAIQKTYVHGSTIVPFEAQGSAGGPFFNSVSFCSHAQTAGLPYSVEVTTNIGYSSGGIIVFDLTINDDVSSYKIYGFIFGTVVHQLDTTGKTVTTSNVGGNHKLSIGTFGSGVTTYTCTGTVRHV